MIHPGVVGPKTRPKGVVDGEQVNIPAPHRSRYERWGDAEGDGSATYWTTCVLVRSVHGEGNPLVPDVRQGPRALSDGCVKCLHPDRQEKPLASDRRVRTANRRWWAGRTLPR